MRGYTVSRDSRTGLYYAHMRGYEYIPVMGSFSEKRSEAMEYAKMYNCLPNKVSQIEAARCGAFLIDIWGEDEGERRFKAWKARQGLR